MYILAVHSDIYWYEKFTGGRKTKHQKRNESSVVPVEERNGNKHCAAQCPTLFDNTQNYTTNNTND